MVLKDLSTYQCKRDPDIEHFLTKYAIPFEKAHKSRTFLVVMEGTMAEGRPEILAYYSLAIDITVVGNDVSSTQRKRLNGIFDGDQIPCYLIGQMGKNDGYLDAIDGDELLGLALNTLWEAHRSVGGRFVRVDCKPHKKLLKFYSNHGFKLLQHNKETGLCELVRFLTTSSAPRQKMVF